MDLDNQDRLRQGLRELADQPVPPGLADRALAGSASLRRRRHVLTALSAVGVIGVIGASVAVGLPRLAADPVDPAAGPSPTPLTCQTATNEPVPPSGDRDHLPAVVRILIELLPPRDDYYVVNALTACVRDGYWVYPGGATVAAVGGPEVDAVAVASAHISLGKDRTGGRIKVNVYRGFSGLGTTCAGSPLLTAGNEMLFCEDAVGDRPLLAGSTYRGDIGVVSIFPDGRGIMVENNAPSIDVDLMRTIATDPDLIALAG
jgi:hypothetical protein